MILPKTLTIGDLNKNKWVTNLKIFLLPIAIIYITSLLGILQQPNHVLGVVDFVPTAIVQGSIITYVLNFLLDYSRKLLQEAGN